jgi:hypothetical protein
MYETGALIVIQLQLSPAPMEAPLSHNSSSCVDQALP